jgi:hypothetical protein
MEQGGFPEASGCWLHKIYLRISFCVSRRITTIFPKSMDSVVFEISVISLPALIHLNSPLDHFTASWYARITLPCVTNGLRFPIRYKAWLRIRVWIFWWRIVWSNLSANTPNTFFSITHITLQVKWSFELVSILNKKIMQWLKNPQ